MGDLIDARVLFENIRKKVKDERKRLAINGLIGYAQDLSYNKESDSNKNPQPD